MNKLLAIGAVIGATLSFANFSSAAYAAEFRYASGATPLDLMERVNMGDFAEMSDLDTWLGADGLAHSDVRALYIDTAGVYWVRLDPGVCATEADA